MVNLCHPAIELMRWTLTAMILKIFGIINLMLLEALLTIWPNTAGLEKVL